MRISGFLNLKIMCMVVLASLGMSTAACNTTKATSDTTVKFFSSTSPDSLFTVDGMVEPNQKVNLFAGVAFENLRQDVARGSGQYVTSLAVLMQVPPDQQEAFVRFVQSRFPALFSSDLGEDRTAHLKMVSSLTREWHALPARQSMPALFTKASTATTDTPLRQACMRDHGMQAGRLASQAVNVLYQVRLPPSRLRVPVSLGVSAVSSRTLRE